MITGQNSLNRSWILLGVLALLLGLAAAAFTPGLAQAQTPAICDEYPNLPVCDEGGSGDDDDGDGDELPTAAAGGPTGSAGDGDGALPFTGYPITDLILLLLLLLAAGLAIRAYLAARERAAHRGAGG